MTSNDTTTVSTPQRTPAHSTLPDNGDVHNNCDPNQSLHSSPTDENIAHTSNEAESTTAAAATSIQQTNKRVNVWAWPWVVFLIFLYIFILFWVNYAILQRYWILHKWNDALPGLDKTELRKFTMRSHMTAGAVAMLLGPIQFIPAFRRRPSLRCIHRWSGRLYCTCAMLSSVFGLWFIALKKQLVGGYNMTASFSMAGIAIGLTSFMAWKTARAARSCANVSQEKALFIRHRNWGIRSFAQILAPALYRYWYSMMELFHIYNVPVPLRMRGYCDANDQCPDYSRPWDSVYTWLYWISAGLVAEIIIYFLPSFDNSIGEHGSDATVEEEQAALTSPLLSRSSEGQDPPPSVGNSTTYGSDRRQEVTPTDVADLQKSGVPFVVNLLGSVLAGAAIAITGMTFYVILATSSPDA
ncbi:DUF2306 domain containing membrane protein [Nitzschia inconspicua]|uniref:DUF2306 domain containing membrane protein n=1 Tax=Nitzschia inconspicua TaxID=303405 RepID=A0A9K3L6G4_9STRA|nr:DUF2306 domain containing membrane protein [Nitzschia inconspicua]